MRLLTLAAVATVAYGVYQIRRRLASSRRAALQPTLSDALLAERVRSAIADAASSAVEVRVLKRICTLRGIVRKAERDAVLAAALAVPGVIQVTNFLETDEPIGDIGPMQAGIATGI